MYEYSTRLAMGNVLHKFSEQENLAGCNENGCCYVDFCIPRSGSDHEILVLLK